MRASRDPRRPLARAALLAAPLLAVVAAAGRGGETGGEPRGTDGPGERAAAASAPREVLVSPLAGFWYEADPEKLTRAIEGYLQGAASAAGKGSAERICALIQPHAGYRWSGPVAGHGLREIAGRRFARVIVVGPSHRVPMENVASVPEATHYATPLGEVPLDVEVLAALRRYSLFQNIPPAHRGEHSVQIQVPLLQHVLGPFRLVPIVVGRLDVEAARAMGRILLGFTGPGTLVVASSDFTHYGPNYGFLPFREAIPERLRELDLGAFTAIASGTPQGFSRYIKETGATVCGRHAIEVLLAMLPPGARAQLLEYDTSGRLSGDHTNSVSYLSIAFRGEWPRVEPPAPPPRAGPLSGEDQGRLLALARQTLRFVLEKGRYPAPAELAFERSAPLLEPKGAFVTLTREGRLRGCTGQMYPCYPLYRTVILQAVQSAFFDSRFGPVGPAELPELRLEISVLTQPRAVSSHREIVIGTHGIVLEKSGRRAVYLPQVAREQGWDLEETLSQLARKAGLPAGAWKEGAAFQVFEAQVFGEDGK